MGFCAHQLRGFRPATAAGGSEASSCSRLVDSCITHFYAQRPSRTCIDSDKEETRIRKPPCKLQHSRCRGGPTSTG